jgi:hypothetical protein
MDTFGGPPTEGEIRFFAWFTVALIAALVCLLCFAVWVSL